MFNANLTSAVENFAQLILPLTEKDLEREWKWKDHDGEGIRFACFVTLQELRHLAVTLATLPANPTPAQHILSQYHAAYLDLQAAVLGLSDEDAEKIPSEGEWQVRKVYAHILGAEINFTIAIRYALEKHRSGNWTPERMSDEDESRLAGMSEADYQADYQALTNSPLSNILAYHRNFHSAILDEFSKIANAELDLSSTFWEETRFPIQHRLHRYEAHFVQHTIQIDKTLVAIGQTPTEAKRLIRKIYAALAEVEGLLIGTEKMGDTVIHATASLIQERTMEIEKIMK